MAWRSAGPSWTLMAAASPAPHVPEAGRAHWWLATSYERVNRFADARHEFEQAAFSMQPGQIRLVQVPGGLSIFLVRAVDRAGNASPPLTPHAARW